MLALLCKCNLVNFSRGDYSGRLDKNSSLPFSYESFLRQVGVLGNRSQVIHVERALESKIALRRARPLLHIDIFGPIYVHVWVLSPHQRFSESRLAPLRHFCFFATLGSFFFELSSVSLRQYAPHWRKAWSDQIPASLQFSLPILWLPSTISVSSMVEQFAQN